MKSQQIFVVFLKWILHLLKWTLLYYCFVLLSRKVLNFGKMIRVICINVCLYTFSAKFLHIFKIFIQLFWPVWPKFCKNYQDFRTCTEAVVISKKMSTKIWGSWYLLSCWIGFSILVEFQKIRSDVCVKCNYLFCQ